MAPPIPLPPLRAPSPHPRSARRPTRRRAPLTRRTRPGPAVALAVLAAAVASVAGAGCSPTASGPVALGGRRGRALPATVVSVVDGDTLDVSFAGGADAVERVRLLGVDTPETVKPDTPVQCFGPEASHHTKALLAPGTRVLVQRDAEARDRYGRLLAYLWRARDRAFVNLELVADGFARTLSIAPNTAYRGTLAAAQDRARARRVGLWGACGPDG